MNENNVNKLISKLSKQLGVTEDQIKDSAQSGNINELLKNGDASRNRKIEEILNDPEKTRQVMNSPQAQAILKLLNGE